MAPLRLGVSLLLLATLTWADDADPCDCPNWQEDNIMEKCCLGTEAITMWDDCVNEKGVEPDLWKGMLDYASRKPSEECFTDDIKAVFSEWIDVDKEKCVSHCVLKGLDLLKEDECVDQDKLIKKVTDMVAKKGMTLEPSEELMNCLKAADQGPDTKCIDSTNMLECFWEFSFKDFTIKCWEENCKHGRRKREISDDVEGIADSKYGKKADCNMMTTATAAPEAARNRRRNRQRGRSSRQRNGGRGVVRHSP